MRARLAGWMVGTIAASAAISAVALGQGSTWGGGAKPAADASAAEGGEVARPSVSMAGEVEAPRATDAGAGPIEAGLDAARDAAADAGSDAAPADDAGDGGDASTEPSVLGFGAGLRGSYGFPIGNANGTSLYSMVQGELAIEGEAGWFLTPHLYIGGYFLYGFGFGNDQNDICSGLDYECSATLIRLGVVVHWHFRPDAFVDPWIGGGLGYEILNIVETNDADGSSDQSWALMAVNATIEGGSTSSRAVTWGSGRTSRSRRDRTSAPTPGCTPGSRSECGSGRTSK